MGRVFSYYFYYKCKILSVISGVLFSHGHKFMVWGKFTIINPHNFTCGNNVSINHDVYINALETISLGDNVALSTGCKIISTGIDPDNVDAMLHLSKKITIGSNVQIGAGAIILPGVNIGSHVIVGAGSVVTKDVPSNSIVVGNPSRLLRNI